MVRLAVAPERWVQPGRAADRSLPPSPAVPLASHPVSITEVMVRRTPPVRASSTPRSPLRPAVRGDLRWRTAPSFRMVGLPSRGRSAGSLAGLLSWVISKIAPPSTSAAHVHSQCSIAPDRTGSLPRQGRLRCWLRFRRTDAAGESRDFAKHLRPEHAKPESCSVHAVSHDFDGLLRVRSAGLLHPAANHGVRLVSSFSPETTRALGRPPLPEDGKSLPNSAPASSTEVDAAVAASASTPRLLRADVTPRGHTCPCRSGDARCTASRTASCSRCGPPTFAAATSVAMRNTTRMFSTTTLPPHREVGSDGRLLASSRAIPSGAVTLRSLPLSQSGCPSLLGPCLLVVSTASSRVRWLQKPHLAVRLPDSFFQKAVSTSRLQSVTESVAHLQCEPQTSPILPWASCSFSNRDRDPRPIDARSVDSTEIESACFASTASVCRLASRASHFCWSGDEDDKRPVRQWASQLCPPKGSPERVPRKGWLPFRLIGRG